MSPRLFYSSVLILSGGTDWLHHRVVCQLPQRQIEVSVGSDSLIPKRPTSLIESYATLSKFSHGGDNPCGNEEIHLSLPMRHRLEVRPEQDSYLPNPGVHWLQQ